VDTPVPQRLAAVGVTPLDWSDFLTQMNSTIDTYNPCNSCCWVSLVLSCGICFCPTMYCGFKQQGFVRRDLVKQAGMKNNIVRDAYSVRIVTLILII
jgi:hypothetical protein